MAYCPSAGVPAEAGSFPPQEASQVLQQSAAPLKAGAGGRCGFETAGFLEEELTSWVHG